MQPEARKLLWDALDAAEKICRFTEGKAFDDYRADEMLRSAVERQFEIIGEALNRFRLTDPSTASTVMELPRIVAFRNILIHGYASIDDRLVWGVVEAKLPTLRSTGEHLLKH
jgi:uncharacterized protein with HEPN domain